MLHLLIDLNLIVLSVELSTLERFTGDKIVENCKEIDRVRRVGRVGSP